MDKRNSQYIALTTGALLYYEFIRILPLLMDDGSARLLKEEASNNKLMQINSQSSRVRFLTECKRRYNSVPASFWQKFLTMSEPGQKIGLLYVILRTYKIAFDFHFNTTVKQWNSIERTLSKSDIMMAFNELSAKDRFVDSWTEKTKDRCAGNYLTILRQAGLLNTSTNELQQAHLDSSQYEYYIQTGEEWFLEACLLYPYQINTIKSELL